MDSEKVNELISDNTDIILKALDVMRSKNKGQYVENVAEFCEKEYDWDRPTTMAAIVNDNKVVANIFNNYFVKITDSLNIPTVSENLVPTNEIIDPLDIALTKYKLHPSVKRIKKMVQVEQSFELKHVSLQEVVVQLHRLNPKKFCLVGSLPTRHLKEHFEVFGVKLLNLINNSLNTGVFSDKLKMGEVLSMFKNEDPFNKKNYRPITVLPAVSKLYERIIQDQIIPFMEPVMSMYLCGFRKGYSTQHALMRLIEKCREFLHKHGHAGALFMNLSKAFDCFDHDLIIAKLHAYGFSRSALALIYSYNLCQKSWNTYSTF